jgi:hypothetical protein
MSGADHLGTGRRERAQPPARARLRGGQHERRLRLVELARYGPHDRLSQPLGVGDDRERVAFQGSVGEHVDEDERNRCAHRGVDLRYASASLRGTDDLEACTTRLRL